MLVHHASGATRSETILQTYNCYRDAKPHLTAHLGEFCSYCENNIDEMNLAVEHIEPKELSKKTGKAYYEHDWDNYLLACTMCNSQKSTRHYLPSDLHLPQNNNTFLSFVYLPGGIVQVNPNLTGQSKQHAKNLMDLTKIGNWGRNCSPKDKRWQYRSRAWQVATDCLNEYKEGKITTNRVIESAKAQGFWSIWFTIFKGEDEVLKRLISDFEGTSASCFDANNHYQPVPRPSNAGKSDPI